MKPPTKRMRNLAVYLVIAITALVPILLTGFLSSSVGKIKTGSDGVSVDVGALVKRISQLNHQKEYQKAVELLSSALDKQPEDSLLRTLLIQTFDLFLEEQIKQGQKDIQNNRKNKEAYFRVSSALELLGDNMRAMEILLNGIKYNYKSTELWMKIAKLELKANRDLEAFDVFREVIRLDNKNSDALNNAAYILAKMENGNTNDLKEAEKLATSATKIDPKNPEYLDTLAEVHFRQGHIKVAQNLMERAIKLAPKNESFKTQLKRFSDGASLVDE
jgi:tetratricopeptide (TPR) repeat protein